MINRVTAAQAVEEVVAALRAGADATAVLGTLLQQARLMLEADEAYILLLEGQKLRLRAAAGLSGAGERTDLDRGEGIEGLAATRGEPVVLLDAASHPSFVDRFDRQRPVGAMVAYPMVAHGKVIGVIASGRAAPGRFSSSDLWWLDLLGGLAAVVVENDRARRIQERRARQAEVLLDVASQSGGEPESLLQRLADTLTRDLGVDRVDALLLVEESRQLVCLGTAGGAACAAADVPPVALDAGGTLCRVLESGQAYLTNEVSADPTLAAYLGDAAMRSALVVPVVVEGRRQGVLLLASSGRDSFGPDDQAFAMVIAARVGVLVEEAALRKRRLELERLGAEAAARQEFVGVVSHELKTPVAVIQAYTEVLLRRAEKAGDTANADVLVRIGEQAERMLFMVEQVLDLQRLEAGLVTLETSRFDLVALARRVAESLAALTTLHEIVVEASGAVPVVADRRRVEEVLQNVLQNAIKYSPDGGRITVGVRLGPDGAEGGTAVVSVADQGIGIAPEEQEQVFERFYQARSLLYQGHVGLGLGLYISRELVRRHGGEMWVESRPGVGSTFYFSLPLAGPDDSEA